MYIYNVTINVENDIHQKWLDWMKNSHIPAMLATQKFSKALMTKVMVEEQMGGITYSVQYTTDSKKPCRGITHKMLQHSGRRANNLRVNL